MVNNYSGKRVDNMNSMWTRQPWFTYYYEHGPITEVHSQSTNYTLVIFIVVAKIVTNSGNKRKHHISYCMMIITYVVAGLAIKIKSTEICSLLKDTNQVPLSNPSSVFYNITLRNGA